MWTVNGTDLHYVIVGTGEPIVVLHGGPGGNLLDMLELVKFAPSHRWVFYDQRGSGESDRFPVDPKALDTAATFFSIEQHVADLEGVREKLGAEQITVLGHSWGGGLAAFYAAAHPDRVKRLIVYNGGPMWPDLKAAKKDAFKARATPEVGAQLAETGKRIGENMESWSQEMLDVEFAKMVLPILPLFDCVVGQPPNPGEIGRGGFWANQLTNSYIDKFDRPSFAAKLAKVNAPALLTYGRCEPNPPERQTFLRDALPNATMVVFDQSGHNAHREQPELFGRVLNAFLTDAALPVTPFDGSAQSLGWSPALPQAPKAEGEGEPYGAE
ncbi:alpha/beta fold hydrolase [Myxococcota bacterium]